MKIDTSIFDESGLAGLTDDEKDRMLAYVTKTLETRVGIRLTAEATEEQLRAFSKLEAAGDNEQTLEWLDSAFPNFEKVAEEELAEIKGELADMAKEVLQARE